MIAVNLRDIGGKIEYRLERNLFSNNLVTLTGVGVAGLLVDIGKNTIAVEVHDTHQWRVENSPVAHRTFLVLPLLLALKGDVFLNA